MSLNGRFCSAKKIGLLGLRIGLALVFLLAGSPAAAQAGGQVHLLNPDSSHFPTFTLNFEAYDAQGRFQTGLQSSQVQVTEDGTQRPLADLNLVQPGLQLTLALDIGPTLAYTYNNLSRFEGVRKALSTWANAQVGVAGDYSLVTSTGSLGTHQANAGQFAQALDSYAPDLMKTQPSLTSLIQALDLATDPLRQALMKRAILFVTPMLPDSALQALPNLADRASQQGIRIFVWLVLPDQAGETAVSKALNDMALRTGGQSFTYSGTQEYPDPETYFQPLRYIYQLTFASAINSSGAHHLIVSLNQAGQTMTSNEQAVNLTVTAPNPIFLSPPAHIQRAWVTPTAASADSPAAKARLEPLNTPLKLMIEFPDGFKRPLKAARLYVDGKLASELTAAPFETFSLDLSGFDASARHTLRVEVEDQLGLKGSSIETPVDVTVAPAPALANTLIFGLEPVSLLLPAGEALGAAGVIVAGVFAIRRLRRGRKASPRRRAEAARPRSRLQMPVPMPVMRRSPLQAANAPARLMRISESGHTQPGSAVPLDYPEITIGSSPKKAAYVLESSSVDSLHARLCRTADGQFMLYDAGSIAGTWVNYAPASQQGTRLRHGDLIQFGRETFRFELNQPDALPQVPCVTCEPGDLPSALNEKLP